MNCAKLYIVILFLIINSSHGQDFSLNNLINPFFVRNSNASTNTSTQINALENLASFDFFKAVSNFATDVNIEGTFEGFLTAILAQRNIDRKCTEDIILTLRSVQRNETWLFQMLDAAGKPPSSLLLTFNLNWIGSYRECKTIKAITHTTDGTPVHHFDGKYCRVEVPLPESIMNAVGAFAELLGGVPALHIGVCLPDTCTANDIRGLMKKVGTNVFNATDYEPSAQCEENKDMTTGTVVAICILSILGFFLVIGTLYDVLAIQMNRGEKVATSTAPPKATPKENGTISDNNTESNVEVLKKDSPFGINGHGLVDKEIPHTPNVTINIEPKQPRTFDTSTAQKLLLSFSIYSNGVKLLNTTQAAGSLGSINGIRFLSMGWVILGHTGYLFLPVDENVGSYIFRKMDDWTFAGLVQGSVSVDTFFTLSGLLVGYLTLKAMKKAGGARKMDWLMFYVHRYWRLTPAYMLVIMVLTTIFPLLSYGPLWPMDTMDQVTDCQKRWWTNLLYINNYAMFDEQRMCMPWSWYLANDMQFYWISPLILVPFYYNAIVGGIVAFVFIAASTIARGFIAKEHEYTAIFQNIVGPKPKDRDFYKNLYMKAHTRIGPYVVGLVAGYILYRCKGKFKINKYINLACWLICISIVFLLSYGVYSDHGAHYLSVDESAVYVAVHRTAWGIAVCWIVFACSTGNGGWINEILSWKGFVPLSRMTYCAYLIHPIVCNLYFLSRERLLFFTDYEVAYIFLGNLTFSYAAAYLTSIAFESPMMGIEKALLGGKKRN